jgi:hypothetical protein
VILVGTKLSGAKGKMITAVLAVGAGGALVALWLSAGSVSAATRTKEANETPRVLRWDVAKCDSSSCDALVVGGHAKWHNASGATIRFTGSGQTEIREGEAAGGGLWTRRNSSGQLVGRGVYNVRAFISWKGFGGTLGNVADAIGSGREVRSGVLKLRVRLSGTGKGRLVLASSSGGPSVQATSHLILHTKAGRRIKYRESGRVVRGQLLFHHIR